ncbi:Reticulon-4-interacting protein 1-like protein, mitochondrial [Trichoplax sp. H2]|nr:Reticulon-4-interacting protein 1-like protein, mitochondrial [Trichoplax sp. H2]|eukprot:RDD42314.1 Reticulon-4-interacting protein 1-like protein, mitochondrial [Trichoplax sp. H2]
MAARLPAHMSALQIPKFGSNQVLQLNKNATIPVIKRPDQLIVKVLATSLNPMDIQIRNGYSAKFIQRMTHKEGTFPLTLGRDFSGQVVEIGSSVRRLQVGDKVWGTCLPFGTGAHAAYTVATQNSVAIKPDFLSHVEAASIPFAGSAAWAGLVGRAKISPTKSSRKKILILGGSGGIGTIAVQMVKAWGGSVVTTCSSDAMAFMKSLGADITIDYRSANAWTDIENEGKYNAILDLVGESEDKAVHLVAKRGYYVTLHNPLIQLMEDLGVLKGAIRGSGILLRKSLRQSWKYGSSYNWFYPVGNGAALDKLAVLYKDGKIKPVIERKFSFEDIIKAYEVFETGHARGKTVITLSNAD